MFSLSGASVARASASSRSTARPRFISFSSVVAAIFTTILFAVSAVCAHQSARRIGGTEANFWRLTVACLVLGAWAFGWGAGLSGEALQAFVWSGVLGIGVGDVAYFQALTRMGSRLTVLLVQCMMAPGGALIEWFWLRTPLTSRQILFGLVTVAGVAIAVAPEDHRRLPGRKLLVGTVFAALAGLGTAGGAVVSRKAYEIVHATHENLDPVSAGFQRVVGGLLLAGIWLLLVKRPGFRAAETTPTDSAESASGNKWRRVWPWIVANGLAGQTIGVSCMQKALETTPTGVVLAIIATTPVAVIPMAYVVEGERPSWRSLVGAAVAVAGVIGLTLAKP